MGLGLRPFRAWIVIIPDSQGVARCYCLCPFRAMDDKIKAIEKLNTNHISQLLNYLKSSDLRPGLLINFGERSLKYKRIIF